MSAALDASISASLPNPAFWAGRRVLLTGHTGFKGVWLALWLRALGARVAGFSEGPLPGRSLFADTGGVPLAADIRGDVRDMQAVAAALARTEPEIVLHLAARSLVRASYAEPAATFATNIMGTVNLLEAARSLNGGCLVVTVTSDKCYENPETGRPCREGDPLGGYDPYSASKAGAEITASAYARSFGRAGSLRIATARAGNVIGGGDWAPDRLVPDLVRALADGRVTAIRNPDAVRPWQHVLEPLCGYLLLCEHLAADPALAGESWNFGPAPASEVSVRTVADRLCGLWGRPDGWRVEAEAGAPHEARLLRLDSEKARRRLGWKPRWDLAHTLAATAALYRADLRGAALVGALTGQIEDYVS